MTSATRAIAKSAIDPAKLQSFTEYLKGCQRIVALLGAGLSASSGLPTFRGAGGLWRSYDATSLATPEAFDENPGLVWQFYSYRRHMALQANPNRAHYALAELSRRNKDFITLSQNVDGIDQDNLIIDNSKVDCSLQVFRNEQATRLSNCICCTALCSTSNAAQTPATMCVGMISRTPLSPLWLFHNNSTRTPPLQTRPEKRRLSDCKQPWDRAVRHPVRGRRSISQMLAIRFQD